MKNMSLALAMFSLLAVSCQDDVKAPEPILPVPSPEQVEWQKMETYAFVHFGLNTFNDREWGYGDTDPATFNPSNLDCEQWVRTFKEAGLTGVILTAKHHDGFCLWPTHLTEYCIRNTPYKNGKGDVVGELAAACRKYGIKFAVYLSPWDRNNKDYGTPAYVEYYHKQLKELMSSYGKVFEVWFDGANGGDGYYGGACETREIDRKTYYDYPAIYEILDSLQPQAVIFGDGGPGCRWVGNEKGFASATNWAFLRKGEVYPGYSKHRELQYGHEDGNMWVPAECDVSIRPGWFYHPEQDDQVKSPEQLADLYYRNVGHNGTFLLNFPVDREGRVHKTDSINAVRFHQIIQKELATDILKGIKAEVSSCRGGRFTADRMTDGDYDTYFATPDSVLSVDITFTLPSSQKVNRMMLQEYIPLGQRVKSFRVEYEKNGKFLPVELNEETTTIGYKRLLRFKTVETSCLRVVIEDSRACPVINRIGAFWAGEGTDEIFSEVSHDYTSLSFAIDGADEKSATKAMDKDEKTNLEIEGKSIVLDLGQENPVCSLFYLPDQGEEPHGIISNYELYTGKTLEDMRLSAKGEFSNILNNPIRHDIHFAPVVARYVKLVATRMADGKDGPVTVAEIGVTEP